jgi:S1-C subfamily serine protease
MKKNHHRLLAPGLLFSANLLVFAQIPATAQSLWAAPKTPCVKSNCAAPARISLDGIFDDAEIGAQLGKIGGRLIDSGKAVKMATLIDQLSRKTCSLALPRPGSWKHNSSQVAESSKPAVLIVARLFRCQDCKEWTAAPASGFFIASSGAFVTSYHVVDEPRYETMIVMSGLGQVFPVREVLAADKEHDIAILRVEGRDLPALAIECSVQTMGSRVYVISHPYGHIYTMTEGIISRYCHLNEDEGPRNMLEITADFAPGSSGAPVLDERGNVAGWVDNIRFRAESGGSGSEGQPGISFHQCGVAADVLSLIQTSKRK